MTEEEKRKAYRQLNTANITLLVSLALIIWSSLVLIRNLGIGNWIRASSAGIALTLSCVAFAGSNAIINLSKEDIRDEN